MTTTQARLRCGAVLAGGSAGDLVAQAVLAEAAGWDGVFVPELAAYGMDGWTVLGAMAAGTSRVRLGTMLTPLSWRKPWQVAGQAATLDQLSGGRAVVAAGIGAADFAYGGEVRDVRERAERLDEGIDLMRLLWAREKRYAGRHYRYDASEGPDGGITPVQQPIPVWAVGVWPRPRSMRRILRCDGFIPQYAIEGREAGPDDARAARAWLAERGAPAGLDMIAEGETPAGDPAAAAAAVAPWAAAGCTWWLETRWTGGAAAMRGRLAAGPPRLA